MVTSQLLFMKLIGGIKFNTYYGLIITVFSSIITIAAMSK